MPCLQQRWAIWVLPGLLLGCASVVSPIAEPPAQSFFYPPGRAPAPGASAPGDGADTCAAEPAWDNSPACFYRGMGFTVEAMERRRQQYAMLARASINDTALYNALLYPAGATVLYRRLRGLPHSGLLFPASVAAAWYGVMSSGIPEPHRHYLRAARELQCSTLRHAEWLYRSSEVGSPADAPGMPSLQGRMRALDEAIAAYVKQRTRVLGSLERAGAPPGPTDAFARAQGRGGGPRKEDPRGRIAQLTLERLSLARSARDELGTLLKQLDQGAWRLQKEWDDIENEVQAGMSERLPPPQDPQRVGADLRQRIEALAQAGEGASLERMDPAFAPELLDGLKSAEPLRALADEEGVALFEAWLAARRFLAEHRQRSEQALRDVETLRCRERAAAVPLAARGASPAASSGAAGVRQEPLPGGRN